MNSCSSGRRRRRGTDPEAAVPSRENQSYMNRGFKKNILEGNVFFTLTVLGFKKNTSEIRIVWHHFEIPWKR